METTIEGLYAAGENAGGLHGADRLGGNMLAGCMISGKIAGGQAAGFATKRSAVEQQDFRPVQLIAANVGPAEEYAKLITELRQSAWDNLLVIKSDRSVDRFRNRSMEIAEEVRAMADDPKDVPVEMENLLIVGKALAAATLRRTESRGGFYRHDHPDPSPEIPEAHIIALSEDNEITLRREVLDPDWNPDCQNMLDKKRWG
jgi:succinate dehydrogenase/fumarate reductase flavoprotein subunit